MSRDSYELQTMFFYASVSKACAGANSGPCARNAASNATCAKARFIRIKTLRNVLFFVYHTMNNCMQTSYSSFSKIYRTGIIIPKTYFQDLRIRNYKNKTRFRMKRASSSRNVSSKGTGHPWRRHHATVAK